MSDSRLEKFIYAICSMDVSDLPVPLSRIEKLWNCLITGETPDFEPLSRNEKYLMAMLDRYDISNLPAPMSRGEKLLYKIAVGETDLSDVPGYLSQYEELLKYLIENGGISEGDFEYVLYTLNQSMYTLYTTAEKPVKSAILRGQTLVNHTTDNLYNTVASGDVKTITENIQTLKNNTEYIVIFRLLIGSDTSVLLHLFDINWNYIQNISSNISPTKNYIKFTTPSSNQVSHFQLENQGGASFDATDVMIIEYQQGMENWDIPYFTGMQSVKMPVLTTIGKNLYNGKTYKGYINDAGADSWSTEWIRTDYFPVEANTDYYFSVSPPFNNANLRHAYLYDENKKHLFRTNQSNKFRPSVNGFVRCVSQLNGGGTVSDDQASCAFFQIAHGTDVSPCEPYKSNILTTNEEVELRKVGNVQDELNLLTGELTQCIGEIVLDGSDDENWANATSGDGWYRHYMMNNLFGTDLAISDKYVYLRNLNDTNNSSVVGKIALHGSVNGYLYVGTNLSLNDFKHSLYQNPITVQYALAEESVKTVDLTVVDQDNQPTQLGTFENVTHVSLEAENLIPEVEMEVATRISTELASASPLMDDISTEQQQLETTVDEQSNNVDATMIATTEIFEEIL